MSWPISPLGGPRAQVVDDLFKFLESSRSGKLVGMNDDHPSADIEALRAEHRALDEQIATLAADGVTDQLELARLKRRKLLLKDKIQLALDSNTPDIIA